MRRTATAIWMALLAACNQQPAQYQTTANAPEAAVPVNEATPAQETNASAPAGRTPLSEPKGPIDPKSVEAAGQIVQHYGALIERQHWLKAEKLWGDIDAARTFAIMLGGRFGQVHLEIGKPGEPEGAAGSIYLTEPVVFYGQAKNGKDLRLPADVILRRVNDVPGSTEAERRWHIERIEWKKPA